MASTNMAVVTGYLGTDPEKRYFPDGTPQTTFRVATTERWKDKDTGEQKSHTEWHNIVTQKGTAEFAATYLKKGDSVQVIGKLRTRKWTDRNGVDRYTTEIRSSDVQSLERKPADAPADIGIMDNAAVPVARASLASRTADRESALCSMLIS